MKLVLWLLWVVVVALGITFIHSATSPKTPEVRRGKEDAD